MDITVLEEDDVLRLINEEGAGEAQIDEIWKALDALTEGMAALNVRLEALSKRIDEHSGSDRHVNGGVN